MTTNEAVLTIESLLEVRETLKRSDFLCPPILLDCEFDTYETDKRNHELMELFNRTSRRIIDRRNNDTE